ncbi:hypothetical protein EJB05_24409 [Eragrostis curvula]|uniref:EGF-like domain-containing protein n=1 Tax=Eragrostis curvula TaxID=38414 RepID=A0A5J9VB80_9POAL|nr:hypothetical protein EJB05_24409 [Eragrostis curvula]
MARTTSATFLFHLFLIVLLATGAQTDRSQFTPPVLGHGRLPPQTPAEAPPGLEAQHEGSESTMPLLRRERQPPPAPMGYTPPCPQCAQTDGGKLTILGRKRMPPSTPVVAPIPGGAGYQADGSEFTLPILGRGRLALSLPDHASLGPDVPKVINIGPCLRSHNEGDTHAFCLKQCMNKGYVGGHCDILPNGFPGDCSCLNKF